MIRKISLLQVFYIMSVVLMIVCAYLICGNYSSINTISNAMMWSINVCSVVMMMVSVWTAFRWFKVKRVDYSLHAEKFTDKVQAFFRWSFIRIILMNVIFFSLCLIQYNFQSLSIPKYCIFVVLLNYLWCRPSWSVFDTVSSKN